MAFDLGSRVIGCVTAEVVDGKVQRIKSCPIIPPEFDPSAIGLLKTKQRTGKQMDKLAWVKFHGEKVSEDERKKRNSLVRSQKDVWVLSQIGQTMGGLIDTIRPDLILVEKNEIFNGMLTSVLLGKVMGTLHGIAGMLRIPIKEYRVTTVRKPLKVAELVKDFATKNSPETLQAIPDVTKRALRLFMEDKFNIRFLTDDESDACVVFNYWLITEGGG